jgi:hypothetical protein
VRLVRATLAFLDRTARWGRWLLIAASATVAMAGLVLALGYPRVHTLMVYAAVALATIGVVLALPSALRTNPLNAENPQTAEETS